MNRFFRTWPMLAIASVALVAAGPALASQPQGSSGGGHPSSGGGHTAARSGGTASGGRSTAGTSTHSGSSAGAGERSAPRSAWVGGERPPAGSRAASSAAAGSMQRQAGSFANASARAAATNRTAFASVTTVPPYSRPRPGAPAGGQAIPRPAATTSATGAGLLFSSPYWYPWAGGYGYAAYAGFAGVGFFDDFGLYDGLGMAGMYPSFGFGYGGPSSFFDPAYGLGSYDPYAPAFDTLSPSLSEGTFTSSARETGHVRLKVKPEDASVYVDGEYVGLVDQYDGLFQKLHVGSGTHRVELQAAGYKPLTFNIRVEPDHTQTYRGELEKNKP